MVNGQVQQAELLMSIDNGILDADGEPTGELFTHASNAPDRWVVSHIMGLMNCDEEGGRNFLEGLLQSGVLFVTAYKDRHQKRKGLKVNWALHPQRPSEEVDDCADDA